MAYFPNIGTIPYEGPESRIRWRLSFIIQKKKSATKQWRSICAFQWPIGIRLRGMGRIRLASAI